MADWYVATTGDNSDGLTWSTAYNAIGTAVTASSDGDTIYIGTGDYDETVNLDTANKSITLDGIDGTATVVRTGALEKGIVLEDNTTLKNLAVSTTSKTGGTIGIYGNGKSNITIEDCTALGAYDGIAIIDSSNIYINNSTVQGYYDGFSFNGSTGVVAESSSFSTNGTYSNTVYCRAVMNLSTGDGIFNNCSITAERDDDFNDYTAGVYNYNSATITLNNCSITVSAGSSVTGNVYGAFTNASARTLLNNCVITTSTAGSGDVYDLYHLLGTCYIVDSSYDRNKVYGTIFEGLRHRRRYDLISDFVR